VPPFKPPFSACVYCTVSHREEELRRCAFIFCALPRCFACTYGISKSVSVANQNVAAMGAEVRKILLYRDHILPPGFRL
jgi:hypothetical protein